MPQPQPPSPAPPAKTSGRLIPPQADLLWFALALAAALFLASLIPTPPNDYWWHLKVGQIIYTEGAIPRVNRFAWTLPADQPFFYAAWLGDLLFYLLHRLGGQELVIFTRNLLLLLTLVLAGLEARRRSASWRLAALAVFLIYAMSLNNLALRPQNWAWLPFILSYLLLSRYAAAQLPPAWLLALPLLTAFWVNVHGSFILGPALIGLFCLGEGLRQALRLPGAIGWRALGWLALAGLLSLAAALLNPRGPEIFAYVYRLLTNPPSQNLISEWQSPTLQGPANTLFFLSILLLILALSLAPRPPTPSETLLSLALLWLAWSGQRYVIWYALAVMPILSGFLAHLPLPWPPLASPRTWLNALLAALLFLPVLLVQPWWVERFPLPQTYWQQTQRFSPAGPLLSRQTPVRAAAYLQQHPGGRLFHEMGYGSYLIWALPEQGVFIDTRIELYPLEQWQDYLRISQGRAYNALLAQYGADRILLDRELQPELAAALAEDPAWTLEYADEQSQIWRKLPAP